MLWTISLISVFGVLSFKFLCVQRIVEQSKALVHVLPKVKYQEFESRSTQEKIV